MPSSQLTQLLRELRNFVSEVTDGGSRFDYAAQRATLDENQAIYAATLPDDVELCRADGFTVPSDWLVPAEPIAGAVGLYFPGGGYYSRPQKLYRAHAGRIAAAAKLRMLLCNYRLAPEHPFPAAVIDAVTTYREILSTLGRRGSERPQVFVFGDSAGGGLALATLLALRDQGGHQPAAAALFSPWTDLTLSGESMISNAPRDPMGLSREGFKEVANLYVGQTDPSHPLVSPLLGKLRGLPPLLFQVSECELLRDDSVRFYKKAVDSGVDAHLQVWKDVPHAWHLFAGRLPEARCAIEDAVRFISSQTAERR